MSVHVFDTMGTVVSVRYPEDASGDGGMTAVENAFAAHDRRFSLYDPDSPLSRIARGELRLADADDEVRSAYAVAVDWRNRTGGAFTPHRPDGVIDLSGVVKAMAIADAGAALDAQYDSWLLSAGGDVLARGTWREAAWRVGIADPSAREKLAGLVEVLGSRRAVATSGTAERGQHIWSRGVRDFVQVTVAADDILTADVLATAIAAGDGANLDRLTADHDIDVLAFDEEGNARATPGARRWVHLEASA